MSLYGPDNFEPLIDRSPEARARRRAEQPVRETLPRMPTAWDAAFGDDACRLWAIFARRTLAGSEAELCKHLDTELSDAWQLGELGTTMDLLEAWQTFKADHWEYTPRRAQLLRGARLAGEIIEELRTLAETRPLTPKEQGQLDEMLAAYRGAFWELGSL